MLADRIKALVDYLFDKYEWVLSLLLRLRHLKVNRDAFVRKTIRRYYPTDNQEQIGLALEESPASILSEKQLRQSYNQLVRHYALVVFFVSFILTIGPEDLWFTIISCALDLIIFQCFLFIAMQKIMMLYGKAYDLNQEEEKGIASIISIDSSGLMIGKYPILQKMKSVLGWLSKQVVKRMGPRLVAKLSRSAFIVVRRQAIKWASLIVTRENLNVAFEALIPLTCAIISGLVSVIIFVPMCNKLRKHLSTVPAVAQ